MQQQSTNAWSRPLTASHSRPLPPPPDVASSEPRPKFDETKLPSCVKSNMKPEEERMKRIKTCRFIEEASRNLRLPRVAISTAMVFLHRFYAVHSFADHDRFEVAIACILIAAKTEESPRKLAHVIQECWKLKNATRKNDDEIHSIHRHLSPPSSSSGNISPRTQTDRNGHLDIKSDEFVTLKERVLLLERVVLHTIGFELSVDHPYRFLVDLCKKLVPSRLIEYTNSQPQGSASQSQKSMMNDLVQSAMNFANDSMHTRLCLQYPAKQIAVTCVYMSCQVCKMKPVENKSWVDILGTDVDMDILCSIALQIMELVTSKSGSDDQLLDSIKKGMEKLHADPSKLSPELPINESHKRQKL